MNYLDLKAPVSSRGSSMKGMGFSLAALLLFAAVALTGCVKDSPSFADESSPVMYFYSDSCYYCRLQKPVLELLAYEGYRVKLMNVDAYPAYWLDYNLSGTPSFIASNGDRLSGYREKDELGNWLKAHGARIKAP